MKLKTDKLGYVRGVRCGQSHGGNDRLAQDGAWCQCSGCGALYGAATVREIQAGPVGGQKGQGSPYRV